jgi:hypothetical protein
MPEPKEWTMNASKASRWIVASCSAALALTVGARTGRAQSAPGCGDAPSCAEVAAFAATITDFRTSVQGRYHIATMTLRFRNRLARPLILGYVAGSGIVTDDRGNRYEIAGPQGVRGIGEIRSVVDPKFALQPGESSDARFEFVWQRGREIFGLSFDAELTVREIDPVAGGQIRLGREHALRFRGLADGVTTVASSPPTGGTSGPVAATPTGVSEDGRACAGRPLCYVAGPFTAEVVQVVGSTLTGTAKDHVLRLSLRFRNVSDQPIVLGYKSGTSMVIDNLGNRYLWGRPGTHDVSTSGIGLVTSGAADPQFALRPGETREASFTVRRFATGRNQVGNAFTYAVTVAQLEILPGQQIRQGRDFSLTFQNLAEGAGAGPASNALNGALTRVEAGKRLLDELKRIRKP